MLTRSEILFPTALLQLYIDGQFQEAQSGWKLQTHNPHTGDILVSRIAARAHLLKAARTHLQMVWQFLPRSVRRRRYLRRSLKMWTKRWCRRAAHLTPAPGPA